MVRLIRGKMTHLIQKHPLSAVFVGTAVVMTLYEAAKELLFKGSLTAWESHSITIFVTACLATLAASFLQRWTDKLRLKEQELEIAHQKALSTRLLLSATQHIVNNFLNQFQLIQLEAEQGEVRQETLILLERSVAETKAQIRLLESIEDPAKKESYDRFYPEKNNSKT